MMDQLDEAASIPSYSEVVSQRTTSTNPTSTASEDVYVGHVLPSFEMHQSLLNRNLLEPEDDALYRNLPDYDASPVHEPTVPSIEAEESSFHSSILNNLSQVERVDSSSIRVSIVVTKEAPEKTCQHQRESPLREYTSGDFVHGYITVENISSRPEPFEMFTVSLEGKTSVYRRINGNDCISSKTFLTMFDLSAGWHYGCMLSSYQGDAQKENGVTIGLPNDRILPPRSKFKKYFTFKLPFQLLDQSCPEQIWQHGMLPPSFGVPLEAFQGRARDIEVNEMLGYGRLPDAGSPIVLKDHSSNTAISYSIQARMISKRAERSSGSNFILKKTSECYIRFIPFGFCLPFHYETSSKDQIRMMAQEIGRTVDDLEAKIRLKALGVAEDDMSEILEPSEEDLANKKDSQLELAINNNIPCFPIPNSSKEKIVNQVSFEVRERANKFMFGSRKDLTKGHLRLYTYKPTEGIPYTVPKILSSWNTRSNLNRETNANLNLMSSALTKGEKMSLELLDFEMDFIPSGSNSAPPQISHLSTTLECITVSSTRSFPVSVSPELFWESEGTGKCKLEQFQEDISEYVKRLKALPKETRIPAHIYRSIDSLLQMKFQKKSVSLFKVGNHDLGEWQEGNEGKWKRKVSLQLELNPMRDLTLVPTFENCLVARLYNLQVRVTFKNCGERTLNIPIRIRKFTF